MMLVGFFGCCGAVRESQCLLGLFFSCLLIIFGAEVAAGIFGFLNKDEIINEVKNVYSTAVNAKDNKTIFVYHANLECCGDSGGKYNTSMCTSNKTKDCCKAIEEFFNEKLLIIGYVAIGIAGIMIIGMIFSMVLCRGIRSNREVL